jgi:RNA polymerase sigma factor (sigma-70 family)
MTMPTHDAFRGLYEAHAGELRGFTRKRVGPFDAEDIVQDTYLHLLQRGAIEALEHPRAFLFRTASNLAVDSLRRARLRSRFTGEETDLDCIPAEGPPPDEAVDGRMAMRQFHEVLDELPPLWRDAFLLNRYDGLSHREIAARLGISVRSVERYVAKTLEHLRSRMERQRNDMR